MFFSAVCKGALVYPASSHGECHDPQIIFKLPRETYELFLDSINELFPHLIFVGRGFSRDINGPEKRGL
jgi:hypothetical protein